MYSKKDGEIVTLNAKEFKILEMLMSNIGRVFTKNKYMKMYGKRSI